MSRATIAHSLGDIIITAITKRVITISPSSSIIWVFLMVEHLKGYCWLWTMLLLSGRHYSGDLKKVSTVTPPFQARLLEMPFDWIVGNSTASLLCKRKTNPEGRCYDVWRWQRPLLFHTSQHFSFQLWPASLLGQKTVTRGAKVCPADCPFLCWLISLCPRRRWFEKKPPSDPLLEGSWKPGHEQTLGRHTQLFPFLWNRSAICIPTRCPRTSCNQNLWNQSTIWFSDVRNLGFDAVETWTVD